MPNTDLQSYPYTMPGTKAIAAIAPAEYCDASSLTVHDVGDPTCDHEFRTSRVDDYAWWRCVKCPCEVGCDIPLPY